MTATTRRSASLRRRLQVADVADVQQVEDTVGKRDRSAGRAIAPRRQLRSSIARDESAPSASALQQSRRIARAQLRRRDGRGASLHDDEPAGVVRQPRGLVERRAGGERQRQRRDDGVARAGDVGNLVGAEDRRCARVGAPARTAPCRGCRASRARPPSRSASARSVPPARARRRRRRCRRQAAARLRTRSACRPSAPR